MAIEFLKKAAKTPQSGEENTRRIVTEILSAIESGGEDKVREYAEKL
jgi:sulfopropanediol 3-dehydrogenase